MNCIYCGTPLSGIDYCTGCGADVTLQKRIIRISNLLYNQGLEKATVRDLSGAIVCLKRSLKFNKENIAARNLLGLVYFETGEVVSALSEWVISKNMNVEGNAADLYIEKLQANKNKLDAINRTIRKYNQALTYCRQDNEDMAVIQLRKVIAQNSKFIKAYHLLALLYLKHQEYEKARKLLKKAAQIDMTNTTTLRYLQEVEAATGISTSLDSKRNKRYAKDEAVNHINGTTSYMSGNEWIIQPATFRDSSTFATFLNIFLGLVLGAAVVWFLAVPAIKQNIYSDANDQITASNAKVASQASQIQDLEDQITQYESEVEEANAAVADAQEQVASYDELLVVARYLAAGDQSSAATALEDIDETTLSGNGEALYNQVKSSVSSLMFSTYRSTGDNAYVSGDYTMAAQNYELALKAMDDEETLWYLAMAYFNLGDTENADSCFATLVKNYGGSTYGSQASAYMTNPNAAARTSAGEAEGESETETESETENSMTAQGE